MIEFKPVRLEDRAVIERYTMPSGICNCDLAFANMYCWQAVFHSAWAEIGGFLVIRFQIDGGERIGYMQPVGEGDFGPILPLLREDAHAHGQRLRIIGLTDEGRDTIRRIVPCHFAFESDRALEDYDKVALYSPNNVLVYYNRAGVYAQLGEIERAVEDYTSAIKLYPDFANAYIYRGRLRELLRDPQGAKEDRSIAQRKIAEYRSRLNDSTYSIYADTTQRFDRLLSFDSKFAGGSFDRVTGHNGGREEMRLLPLFKFTLMRPDSVPAAKPYHLQRVDDFKKRIGNEYLTLSCRESNIAPDTLVMLDKQYVQELNASNPAWTVLFERAVTQSLIKQYTNSVSTYSSAIELNPSNPFLYLNRSTTRAEMIDFISSIDNSYQRITIDSDPANRLNNNSKRTYSYDEAVADLNKAVKLFPDFAYAYYNRANLLALSGSLPEAFEDYTKAISLNPAFAEAYYNRGIIQLFMKDTRKGCLDLSKAGELGITEAYEVLKRYASLDN